MFLICSGAVWKGNQRTTLVFAEDIYKILTDKEYSSNVSNDKFLYIFSYINDNLVTFSWFLFQVIDAYAEILVRDHQDTPTFDLNSQGGTSHVFTSVCNVYYHS